MNPVNPRLNHTLSLKPNNYRNTLDVLRVDIKGQRAGFINVQLDLPVSELDLHLQLRCTDLYIIGFCGNFGWYHFADQEGEGWGQTVRGVNCNYPDVERDTIDVPAVDQLSDLGRYQDNTAFNRQLILIAGAVVSESLRFDTVAKSFTALFDKKLVVPLRMLVNDYFKLWKKRSQEDSPADRVLLKSLDPSASVASSSSGR